MGPDLPLQAASRVALPAHVVHLQQRVLLDADGAPVELRPQALDVLCLLAAHAGRLVTKDELLEQVWPGMVVTDDSLVQAISDARRAIGDDAHRVIQTVPRRGYRLVAAAEPGPASAAPEAAPRSASDTSATGATQPPRRRWALAIAPAVLLAAALAAWQPWSADVPAPPSPAPDRPPIAVLDFGEPEATPDDRAMARAFSEELTNELSRNADLHVIAANSSFAAMREADTPAGIAARLGVRYLVGGSLRREGETLRLNVRLLDGHDGQVVWSERHSVGAGAIIATRDALLERIAGSLHSSMRHNEEARALQRPPASLDIYAMTLRAITLKHRDTAAGALEARRLFEQVVALDPNYAPGWLYLGMNNSLITLHEHEAPFSPERLNEAIAQMEKSITLNPGLPAAYLGLAFSYPHAGRNHDAVKAGRRCLELGPSDAECMTFLAAALVWAGQPEEALGLIRRSMAANPIPPHYVLAVHGLVLETHDDFASALEALDECRRRVPAYLPCRSQRVVALARAGRLDEARADVTALRRDHPQMPAEYVAAGFAPEAAALVQRRIDAARQAGWPAAAELAKR